MAKSARRRHDTERLLAKWKRLHEHLGFVPESSLGFGKIYKQDPLDCGNPECKLCHHEKIFKAPRNNTIRNLKEDTE